MQQKPPTQRELAAGDLNHFDLKDYNHFKFWSQGWSFKISPRTLCWWFGGWWDCVKNPFPEIPSSKCSSCPTVGYKLFWFNQEKVSEQREPEKPRKTRLFSNCDRHTIRSQREKLGENITWLGKYKQKTVCYHFKCFCPNVYTRYHRHLDFCLDHLYFPIRQQINKVQRCALARALFQFALALETDSTPFKPRFGIQAFLTWRIWGNYWVCEHDDDIWNLPPTLWRFCTTWM